MNTIREKMEARVEGLNMLLKEAKLEVSYIQNWKNNIVLDGYCIKAENSECAPTIYYDEEWFEQTDEALAEFLCNTYAENELHLDVSKFMNHDFILRNVYPKLIGNANKEMLEKTDRYYFEYLDMFILFDVVLDEVSKQIYHTEDGHASMILTNNVMKGYNITEEELYKKAFENLTEKTVVATMHQILCEKFGFDLPESDTSTSMIICTTKDAVNGASAILCDNVRAQLDKIFGGKYVVFPSSVHETIVVPFDEESDIAYYREMVKEINQTEVNAVDKLTDSVYIVENGVMRLAA